MSVVGVARRGARPAASAAGLVGRHPRVHQVLAEGLGEDAARHVVRRLDAEQREHGGRDVEDGRLIESRPRLHAGAVQIDDAFDVVEALAHAAQVARLRGIVVELAEIEAVIGEHHQRGVVVDRVHELAEQLVGEDVHLLDRVPVVLLLRRQLAAELAGAEQVTEEVRRRVDALDVDHARGRASRRARARGRCRDSCSRSRTPT